MVTSMGPSLMHAQLITSTPAGKLPILQHPLPCLCDCFAGLTVTSMGPTLMHAQLTKQRIAALNGSLVFGSLGGLLVPVVGNFSLQVRQIWPSEVFVIVRHLRLFITFM